MKNWMSIVTTLISALIVGCASTAPSGQSFDSPIGVWTERLDDGTGAMRSSQVLFVDNTLATYTEPHPGRFEFFSTTDDREWKAYWINNSEGKTTCGEEKGGSATWGVQTFRFNDSYNRYSGAWDYCGEGVKYPVSGIR